MMKKATLIVAAVLTVASSAYTLSLAGWLGCTSSETHVQASDPIHSDAAIRYRQNQSLNWRCIMMLQD